MANRKPALMEAKLEGIVRAQEGRVDRGDWGKAISDLRRLILLLP